MGWTARLSDLALAPLVAGAALPMRAVRSRSIRNIPISLSILKKLGVFPIRYHYYEPLFDASDLINTESVRELPGIDLNSEKQLTQLSSFKTQVVPNLPSVKTEDVLQFTLANTNFEAGDAEIWYHVIRYFKPRRIVEIGSGHSTKMARLAIADTSSLDHEYSCDHVCIEPYEMPWLEQLGVRVVRNKLEDADLSVLDALDENDILFIDSSHMIRPQGEVLLEFLHILPRLKSGVIVHIHDIFTPRDYPIEWIEHPRFWNEQYLLEAFLTQNEKWEVLLALNMLKMDHYAALKAVCPYLTEARRPGSFYIRRR